MLLDRFPPQWPEIIADHVTLDPQARRDAPLPCETSGGIAGAIDDGEGLQALVVAIAGTTARSDGGTYHITWSLDLASDREAAQSNEVIDEHGWRSVDDPIPITLIPARF